MKIRVHGSTGSLPTALSSSQIREKIKKALVEASGINKQDGAAVKEYVESLPLSTGGTFRGNSTCVEVITDIGHRLVLDAGSGLRMMGKKLVSEVLDPGSEQVHLFFTHLHWDHLMGFPHFDPLYSEGFQLHIYGVHEGIIDNLRKQQTSPGSNRSFGDIVADIHYHPLESGKVYEIGGARVEVHAQNHPGKSYGYRIESGGRAFVLATDSEFPKNSIDETAPFLQFFSQADVLMFDSQYDLVESLDTKRDWGHSSPFAGVDLANEAEVRTLVLFHHEPSSTDEKLEHKLESARAYAAAKPTPFPKRILSAFDGMEMEFTLSTTTIFFH